MKYQSKPEVVDAFQLGIDPAPEWFKTPTTARIALGTVNNTLYAVIESAAGTSHAVTGDIVVKRDSGEIIAFNNEQFHELFKSLKPKSLKLACV